MAFNAKWELEQLAQQMKCTIPVLLADFNRDLADMIGNCPVFRLNVSNNGNRFVLTDKTGKPCSPLAIAGLYSIFTAQAVIYFGEATDLYRRQLEDPDNTADSNKVFNNQGRAIIKLLLHNGWGNGIGLDPMFVQLYPANCSLTHQNRKTFEACYKVSHFSKALEGAMSLFICQHHNLMINRAKKDGF